MASVTVVMPAYNASRTIEESVQSVIDQLFEDWELLIIDDHSSDNTADIARLFASKDDRIAVHRNRRNMGAGFSRKRGIDLADSPWVAFLDADDLWTNDKLTKQLAFMEKNNAQLSYTASAFITSTGEPYDYILPVVFKTTLNDLLERNLMSCSSVIAARELVLHRPFPMKNTVHEDYVLWLRVLKEIDCAFGLNEPLLKYRISPDSKSANRMKSALMTYNAYRELGISASTAAGYTLRYAKHSIKKRKLITGGKPAF